MCHAEEVIHETLFVLLFYQFENVKFLKFLSSVFDVTFIGTRSAGEATLGSESGFLGSNPSVCMVYYT